MVASVVRARVPVDVRPARQPGVTAARLQLVDHCLQGALFVHGLRVAYAANLHAGGAAESLVRFGLPGGDEAGQALSEVTEAGHDEGAQPA
jgi:hypothetical protein